MASIHIGCWLVAVSNEKAAAEKEVAEKAAEGESGVKKAAVENTAQNKINEIWSS
jgi:hypothetical protein